jgi:hypothetical protein
MPYIKQMDRKHIDMGSPPRVGGELAYVFLAAARQYIANKRDAANYNSYADVIAAMEVAKFIFQDEDVRWYEAVKRQQNGDVT